MATWIAGEFFGNGAYDQIYPNDTTVFTVTAPRSWHDALSARGYEKEIYPYIYPPLWAALIAPLTKITSFELFRGIASLINPAMMLGCVLLALRITRMTEGFLMPFLVGMAVLFGTWVGQVCLIENQPQILLTLLILLAIERSEAGAAKPAALALAIAAALKVYPALFVPLFLAAGYRRTVLWFIPFGAALGLSSIALAGWPLHAQFLEQLQIITQTVLIHPVNFSWDSLWGQLFLAPHLQFEAVPSWYADPQAREFGILPYLFTPKPHWWKLLTNTLILGTVALGTVLMWRAPRWNLDRAWIWPFILGLYALVSPLAWVDHFLFTVAFSPQFLARFGMKRGIIMLLSVNLPISVPAPFVLPLFPHPLFPFQLAGCLSMTALVALCAVAMRKPAPTQPG